MVKPNQPANIEVLEDFEDYDPRDDQILELSGAVSELAEENKLLRDGIMARFKPSPEDGSISISQVVSALEKEIHILRENNRVVSVSRDHFMNEVSVRQRAAMYWRARAKKVEKQLVEAQKNA